MGTVRKYFMKGFEESSNIGDSLQQRRIGAELKFPLVNMDGSAVEYEVVEKLWEYLHSKGWSYEKDKVSGKVIGASTPGEQNDTVAGCETGYCKVEFSLAHVANLFDLQKEIASLKKLLHPFAQKHNVRFLGYGIHPVTPPSQELLMKKGRTSVWHKIFGSNNHIPEDKGYDFHLFTVNSASHVHISVDKGECVDAVNILNGFTGPQIALTANSNIWKGGIDPKYKCVAESFWDWWIPEGERVGVPEEPFDDLGDYCDSVCDLRPVFVKRGGKPIVLEDYDSFSEYIKEDEAVGVDHKGNEVSVEPKKEDFDLHTTCYWYNARLSRYYTVENRANDQQPPDEMLNISAMTLGLVSAQKEANEVLESYDWDTLRKARKEACINALEGSVDGNNLIDMSRNMLDVAEKGLKSRGKGEERFLENLKERVKRKACPADDAEELFKKGNMNALLEAREI